MPPTLSSTRRSSPTGSYATPRLAAARMSLLARIAASGDGFTLTWSGPSCARLSKAPALRQRPSGLVEHARGGQRVPISGYRVRLLRRGRCGIQLAVALLDPSGAE